MLVIAKGPQRPVHSILLEIYINSFISALTIMFFLNLLFFKNIFFSPPVSLFNLQVRICTVVEYESLQLSLKASSEPTCVLSCLMSYKEISERYHRIFSICSR